MNKYKIGDILYIDLNNQYYGYECIVKDITQTKNGTKYIAEFKMESMLRACEGEIETCTFELDSTDLRRNRDELTKYSSSIKMILPTIRIKEIQLDKFNPGDKQERIIKITDWYSYVGKFEILDGFRSDIHPSLPRRTLPTNLLKHTDYFTCEFFHRVINKTIFHSSEIVNE